MLDSVSVLSVDVSVSVLKEEAVEISGHSSSALYDFVKILTRELHVRVEQAMFPSVTVPLSVV